jgi:hypothetical protein
MVLALSDLGKKHNNWLVVSTHPKNIPQFGFIIQQAWPMASMAHEI